MERQQVAAHDKIRRRDAAFYQELENSGFLLGHGEDETGLVPRLFRRGPGYYVDIGASGLSPMAKSKCAAVSRSRRASDTAWS